MCDHSTESKHIPPYINISIPALVANFPRIHLLHLQDPDRLYLQEITVCTFISVATSTSPI